MTIFSREHVLQGLKPGFDLRVVRGRGIGYKQYLFFLPFDFSPPSSWQLSVFVLAFHIPVLRRFMLRSGWGSQLPTSIWTKWVASKNVSFSVHSFRFVCTSYYIAYHCTFCKLVTHFASTKEMRSTPLLSSHCKIFCLIFELPNTSSYLPHRIYGLQSVDILDMMVTAFIWRRTSACLCNAYRGIVHISWTKQIRRHVLTSTANLKTLDSLVVWNE